MSSTLDKVLEQEQRIVDWITSNLDAYASVLGYPSQRHNYTHIAYASSPITTGPRMYEAFKQHGVSTVDNLTKISPHSFKHHIITPNIHDGKLFWQAIQETGNYNAVICPATFFAKGWTQEHYMSLWERVIETFTTVIHFNNGWHLSNGCAEEYLIGLRTGKQLYEGPTQTPLPPEKALTLLEQGINHITALGADTKPLTNTYRRIYVFHFTKKQNQPLSTTPPKT